MAAEGSWWGWELHEDLCCVLQRGQWQGWGLDGELCWVLQILWRGQWQVLEMHGELTLFLDVGILSWADRTSWGPFP